jgi:hypothetical protein
MAHFGAYNTGDPNAGPQGYTPLANNGVVTLGPMGTETAQSIAFSIFTDQAGTLLVQQTFDGINWDISQSFAVVASTAQSGVVPVIAPSSQIVFTNTGGSTQTVMRLFARTFATGRG